jgi:ABC-2 type transport system ATP-binding protein
MKALVLQELRKSYGDKEVVRGLSLEAESGEILGLLGPNGAGKSTTINMIAGVTRVGGGKIFVFGHDVVDDYINSRRLTGVMHQEIVVDTFFTIDRALKIHSGYYGVPDQKAWREELIERLALGPHLTKSMNRLSGGMKRRFMVAKALIHQPKLLILDEPTAGVDVELRQNLWHFVRELNQKKGTTVLLTTHYLEEAQEMCGRVAILNQGELIALDRTKSLLEDLDERVLRVHLEKPITSVPAAFHAWNPVIEASGDWLSFRIGKGMSSGDVFQLFSQQGLVIREVETKAPSLQEVFLKLTKGSMH